MILGFAHVTHGTDDGDAAVSSWMDRGWTLMETHRDIPSAPEKWPLTELRPVRHDLFLLKGPLPLEVIVHDAGSVEGRSRIQFDPEHDGINILVRDENTEAAFFRDAMGFRDDDNGTLQFAGRFPQWSVNLTMLHDPEAPLDPPLDLEGLTCLAFYSTNPEVDGAFMEKCGGRALTETFEVVLNGRKMEIVMMRSPEGTVIELIKVKKQA